MCKKLIFKYQEKYIELRKLNKPFSERKHFLDMIEVVKAYQRSPYIIPTTQELIKDLRKNTDRLLEEYNFKYTND